MSETTVDQVPDEVLAEVFKWLDTKSLKNAVLTCQEWKKVVEQSIPWTLRLDYENGEAQAQIELVLASNRKYGKASLVSYMPMEFGDNMMLQILEKHGGRVKELLLIGWKVADTSLFCQLLKTMPKLESIEIRYVVMSKSIKDLNAGLLPVLENLKFLEMDDSSCNMLKFFEQCQIQKLKISGNRGVLRQQLLDFFATQGRLDELALQIGLNGDQLFADPIPEEIIQFRLKKLSLMVMLCNYPLMTPHFGNNMIEFVKLHDKSLEELEINRMIPESFFEFAFAQLKHAQLKTLKLDLVFFSHDSTFLDRLAVNTNVTVLQIIPFDRETSDIKGFLNRLPNVENLTLDAVFRNGIAKYIAENMKKLKKFSVRFFGGQEFDGLRFHALETLRIDRFRGPVNWNAFTKSISGVIDLWVGFMENPYAIDIQAITENLNLRQLTIESSHLSCDAKFFEIIRKNCANLESLQLNVKSLKVDIATVADIPNLRFRDFPRNY